MTFNLEEIEHHVAEHGEIIRVLIVATKGSTPRETGTRMLVWEAGQKGTIGGGALEWNILATCRSRLATGKQSTHIINQPLGPGLGQCCGGHLKLVLEYFNVALVQSAKEKLANRSVYTRPIKQGVGLDTMPEFPPTAELPAIKDRWLTEDLVPRQGKLWVFGSGHVGTAIVKLVANLPAIEITWIDFQEERFPKEIPTGVKKLVVAKPEHLTKYAPDGGYFLVLTHSHDLDLKVMEGLLRKDFSYLGLIGSKTKWSRFQQRLRSLGIAQEVLDKVKCPIGERPLGKHPWQIAIGVSAELLTQLNNRKG